MSNILFPLKQWTARTCRTVAICRQYNTPETSCLAISHQDENGIISPETTLTWGGGMQVGINAGG